MADILIRGVEMPKEGNWKTIRIYPDGTCAAPYWTGDCKVLSCVAVPLPEGHGRLGDLDKLEDAFIRYYLSQERSNHLVFTPVEIKQHFADMIGDWPAIVPAEGGANDEHV